MAKIVLTTLNARYHHTAIALYSLYANLHELQRETVIHEFTIKDNALEMANTILLEHPEIVGFGIYIWNLTQITEVILLLKKIKPEIKIIIGGPEVSYEYQDLPAFHHADHLIRMEGEIALHKLCQSILNNKPAPKVITSEVINPEVLQLPYPLYRDDTIQNRVIYFETSRGCPYRCNFCLSALDQSVRYFPMEGILTQLKELWDRGVRQFKFIDRTFNLKINRCEQILQFFLNQKEQYFLHFELVPDRLPDRLKALIEQFPSGSLQFEVGLQSMDTNTLERIGRKQDMTKTLQNLTYLFKKSTAHIHTDLIVGLPGESLEQFEAGFNQLMNLNPNEIQVGILKKLRGALIAQFDTEYQMVYAPNPPYQILSNSDIPFEQMIWMIRFAKYWDLFYNNGYFKRSIRLIFTKNNFFKPFMSLTRFAFTQYKRTHGIALNNLAETLFHFLTEGQKITPIDAAVAIGYDLLHTQNRKTPRFLKPFTKEIQEELLKYQTKTDLNTQPSRQQRHQ